MKGLLTLMIAALSVAILSAQNVVNGGFEFWEDTLTYQEPVDWNSNVGEYYLSGLTIEATDDAYAGDSAVIVRTLQVGGVVGNVGGFLTNGTNNPDSLGIRGWQINYRPHKLTGYYKYNGAVGDSARVILYMNQYDQVFNRDSLVATGNIALPFALDYTYFEFDIRNAQPGTSVPIPDSYVILITSTRDLANPLVSTLTIDHLNFEGVVSAPEVNQITDINVYPNPATDHFVINSPTHRIMDVAVLSAEGRQVHYVEATSGATDVMVNTTRLSKGFYYVQIRFENGAIETRFITVVK